jgi:GNAT superfamily N-acetyltransferase
MILAVSGPCGQEIMALSYWTPERVLDAAAAWVWVPDGAITVSTVDYQLIRYPDRLLDPTFPAAQVTWSKTTRPLNEVIAEIAAHVRGWGLGEVHWWVSAATRPAGTEEALQARGAQLSETVQVLGCVLDAGLPELDPPAEVTVGLVRDEPTVLAASFVAVHGWGRAEPGEADLARQLDEAVRDLRTWSGFRVVAFADGRPVSTGGCTLAGGVAQLWGAVTLPDSRRRGGYRAVLAERLRLARDHGATLALVKGRVLTSAPILLRAGFTDFGQERRYRLTIT